MLSSPFLGGGGLLVFVYKSPSKFFNKVFDQSLCFNDFNQFSYPPNDQYLIMQEIPWIRKLE